MAEPLTLIAGDSVTWTRLAAVLPDGSAAPASDGWALAYRFAGPSAAVTVTGTAAGDDWTVTLLAATTAPWAAGDYAWSCWVSKGTARHTLDTGVLTVSANPATAPAADARSPARLALKAIEATLSGRVTADVEAYQIAGRQVTRLPIPELIRLRGLYRAEVAREDAAERLARGLGCQSHLVRVRL